MGRSPLRGTVEPERMSGLLEARVRLRNVCQVERSRPQCSSAGKVEAARRCQISGKTQTCIRGFQLPPAVCVRSAYRRAWRWWTLPGRRRGPPGSTIWEASCAASTLDCQRSPSASSHWLYLMSVLRASASWRGAWWRGSGTLAGCRARWGPKWTGHLTGTPGLGQ